MAEVSVIITTHNRPQSLSRAIESVRAASVRAVEIVVVDDASFDETARVCRDISGINYVRTERNQGVAGARNIGLLVSRGNYVSFLDDDDVRLPGSLDKQIEALASFPEAGFIYGRAIVGNQDGTATDKSYPTHCKQGDVFWELLAQNFVPCGAAVFRRSCLYRIGLLDDSLSGIDDWDFWLRLAECYPVMALPEPVMIWRQSTPVSKQGSSRAVRLVKLSHDQFHHHWLRMPRAIKSFPGIRRKSRRRFSENMARHLLWEAWRALAAGKILSAQENILAALRLYPTAVARIAARPSRVSFLLKHASAEWRTIRLGADFLPK